MLKCLTACTILLAAVPAVAQLTVPQDAKSREALRRAGAEVLFWNQAQRDRNFCQMERVFPTLTVRAGTPRLLPRGRTLPIQSVKVDRFIAGQNIAGLIVLQDGRVRLERYARSFSPAKRWTSFSVAKSLTSTLIGAAVKDGSIRSLDDQVVRYVPELKGTAYDGVSVRQVLTMSSGVKWNEDYTDPKSDVAQMFARPVPAGEDVTVAYLKKLPRAAAPGSTWNYNTAETNLAGVILGRAVKMPISRYASLRVWRPMGMEADAAWQVDEHGHEIAGCCLSARLRDYGRLGQLMLDDGRTPAGQRILPTGWVKEATSMHHSFPGGRAGYGYFWWTSPRGYRASGIFGQSIWVDPQRRVVIAALSAYPRAVDESLSRERQAFFTQLAIAASPSR
ncbi:MAG TPA: serine hydrolase domain-containing protein [Sphingomicrobium sp.]|nr:serine hydrolase domain-containing protein [Sphingomicrobium sp.]